MRGGHALLIPVSETDGSVGAPATTPTRAVSQELSRAQVMSSTMCSVLSLVYDSHVHSLSATMSVTCVRPCMQAMPTASRGMVSVQDLTWADKASGRGGKKPPPRPHPAMLGPRASDSQSATAKPPYPWINQPLVWWDLPKGESGLDKE